MPFRFPLLLLTLVLLLPTSGCDRLKSHLNSLLGREEAVTTVVQTQWEAEPETVFGQIKVEDSAKPDAAPSPNAALTPPPPPLPAPAKGDAKSGSSKAKAKESGKSVAAKAEKKAKEPAASKPLLPPPAPMAEDGPPKEGGIYSVQVGAFASAENAERLKVKLAQQGYQPVIEEIRGNDGREWQALRIGRTDSLQEAKELAVNYANANHLMVVLLKSNRIVEVIRSAPPAPLPKPVSTAGATVPGKGFVSTTGQLFQVQVGGLFDREEAEKQRQKIDALGLAPRLVPQRDKFTGEMWYVIRIGEFSTREAAGAKADEIQLKHGWATSVPEP